MICYRLTRAAFADLSGAGGLYRGGRCHLKGTPVIYAAAHISLALAEIMVHPLNTPLDYVVMTIDVPDNVPVRRCSAEEAKHESRRPAAPVYIVPSVVVPQEFNIILFPKAKGFRASVTSIEPFRIDQRLILIQQTRNS